MKRRLLVALIVGLATSMAQAQGLAVFGSYWEPEDGDETFGAGAKLKGGAELFFLELRGTYYEDITEDVGPADIELQVIPVDLGLGIDIPIHPLETGRKQDIAHHVEHGTNRFPPREREYLRPDGEERVK